MAYLRLCFFALLMACDPGDPSDAGMPRLEIGTGEGAFSSFDEGATLQLVCGPQGAQHIWIALRAWGIDPRGTILDLSLTLDVDAADAVVSQSFLVRVSLQPVEGQDYAEVVGLTLVIPEPDRAIDQDVTLRASVESVDGTILSGMRDIRVQWAPDSPCAGP